MKQSVADWAAVFDLFDEALASALRVERAELRELRASISWVSPPCVGLGEAYPRQAPDVDDFASTANRRVDIACLAPGTTHYLGSPPDGERLYGIDRVFRRVKLFVPDIIPDERLDTFVAHLVDELERPIPDEPYELWLPDGTTLQGRLDAQGWVRRTGVPGGMCELVFPELDAREWSASVIGPRPVAPPPDFVGALEPDLDDFADEYEDDSTISDEHDEADTGDELDDREAESAAS